jgi:hypothetical protein
VSILQGSQTFITSDSCAPGLGRATGPGRDAASLAATIAGNTSNGSWQNRLRQCQIQITYALFDSRPAENRLSLQLTFLESQGKSETGLFIDTEPA